VYVYFRYTGQQTVMCVMNQNEGEKEIGTGRFAERLQHFTQARNVIDGSVQNFASTIKVPGKTVLVAELK
jgi:hypothetical protein